MSWLSLSEENMTRMGLIDFQKVACRIKLGFQEGRSTNDPSLNGTYIVHRRHSDVRWKVFSSGNSPQSAEVPVEILHIPSECCCRPAGTYVKTKDAIYCLDRLQPL